MKKKLAFFLRSISFYKVFETHFLERLKPLEKFENVWIFVCQNSVYKGFLADFTESEFFIHIGLENVVVYQKTGVDEFFFLKK